MTDQPLTRKDLFKRAWGLSEQDHAHGQTRLNDTNPYHPARNRVTFWADDEWWNEPIDVAALIAVIKAVSDD